MEPLSTDESDLFRNLLFLTGKEDRLSRTPLLTKEQITAVKSSWTIIKDASRTALQPSAMCDLLNRLLLSLGIKPVSYAFYEAIFGEVDLSDLSQVKDAVKQFRIICMLEYGNFPFGYKQFREGKFISQVNEKYFPSKKQRLNRSKELTSRLRPLGLISIAASQLFSLGYLASEHSPKINAARKDLLGVLTQAQGDKVVDFIELQQLAKDRGVESLPNLLGEAGIPGAELLIYNDLPLFAGKTHSFGETLATLIEGCVTVDEEAIRQAREDGLQNSRTYMAMHDLDIYIATSMRDPLHFTTNSAFVQRLFHEGVLAEWRLRYFDPTQAYLENRIQKGLLECLMIKRAKLTIYNAQEADTFGKDAEAGVTLAQAKPVIAYVARLFEHLPSLQRLYQAIDQGARIDRNDFVRGLMDKGLLDGAERDSLLAPEKTKGDAVTAVVKKHAPAALEAYGKDRVAIELIRQGYGPQKDSGGLIDFSVQKILLLERRALMFRDVHPLSLQTSPIDGVARGVIVTRTIDDTAQVVSGIFLGQLKYEIIEDEHNWLLVDQITRSPIRVMTKDPILTTAFWSEDWPQRGTP